jgi:hypothetical protein
MDTIAQTATIHHNFENPSALQGSEEARLVAFCCIRDEIREYSELSWWKTRFGPNPVKPSLNFIGLVSASR